MCHPDPGRSEGEGPPSRRRGPRSPIRERRRRSAAVQFYQPVRDFAVTAVTSQLLRLGRFRRVPARTVVVVLAERGTDVRIAADPLDPERLLVRLAVHDHGDEIVAGVRQRAARAAKTATTTAPASSGARIVQADQLPDAIDRIQRLIGHRALRGVGTTPAATCRARDRRRATSHTRRTRTLRICAERRAAASATATTPPSRRYFSRPCAEGFPLRRRMVARLATGAATSTTTAAAASERVRRGLGIRHRVHRGAYLTNCRGVVAGTRQRIEHLRRARVQQHTVTTLR